MAKQYIMHDKGDMLQGRYCIDSVLGEGGFGVTYKAKDTYMDVPVAIKEYNNKNVSGYDEAVKEAKIAAGFYELDCIASARDFFVENDLAYIVMEYVSGISIKRYIKENGHMSGQVVLNKVKPLMQSLMKIHENGVIHRDISSDNLMITKDKKLVLIDFGAARFMKEYENKDYTVIVKRGFSPIEQCHSNGRQGPYTDIYSLCATMYYMITGIIPDDCVERVVKDKLKPLSTIDGTGLTANECAAINEAKSRKKHRIGRHSSISEAYIHPDRNTHEAAQTYDSDIPSISAKYISELLNISLQKEKLMNMTHALRKLDSLHTDDECPEAIWQLISDKPLSVSEGKNSSKGR